MLPDRLSASLDSVYDNKTQVLGRTPQFFSKRTRARVLAVQCQINPQIREICGLFQAYFSVSSTSESTEAATCDTAPFTS